MFVSRLSLIAQDTLHVWELLEVKLQSQKKYTNPYTDVEVWIELTGPGLVKEFMDFGTAAIILLFVLWPLRKENGPGLALRLHQIRAWMASMAR
jgi:hypothetical protein